MSAQAAADALRHALAAGSYDELANVYAERALLDANLRGGRRRIRTPVAIAAALARWWSGPAEMAEWTVRVHPAGFELWAERIGSAGASRTRQYARVEEGRITRHWIYAAPPRTPSAQSGGGGVHLDPHLLAGLGDVVEHEPLISRGWSGNVLERLVLSDGRRLVAKRIVPGSNWIDRHTADEGREALLFRSGVLDRVPGQAIDHAIVAAERDGEAWWVVMKDVSDSLLSDDRRLSRAESLSILTAVNRMWEEFWGETIPHLSSLRDCFGLFSPAIAESERNGLDLLPKQYEVFWEAFTEAVDPDVADGVLSLHQDPAALVSRLDALGTTLVHGDIRDEQIGLAADRLILLDWGLATQGHPVVDFAWSICHNAWRIDATHDALVEDFRRVRGERDDPRANELIGLVGLLMYGWIFGHSAAYHPDPGEREWAREELAWWVPQARRGLEAIAVA